MKRTYDQVTKEHFDRYNKMLLLAGPRQVGKTTIAEHVTSFFDQSLYLNWDNEQHQRLIITGPQKIIEYAQFTNKTSEKRLIIFDEIHKYSQWKNYIKGFYDTYKNLTKILITGSARLDIYHKGGDSMMGRYFLYRIHPLSVAEINNPTSVINEISPARKINDAQFSALYNFGGFPEPFIEREQSFYNKWKSLHKRQLLREDLRDLSRVENIAKLELLADLLKQKSAQLINYNELSKKILVSIPTIQNWISLLNSSYYCYLLHPWHKNISRSLVKQPKIFLWDWSNITDPGAKAENFIAGHLLKAVHYWSDNGLGDYDLYFLRDREMHEVDFLVTKNGEPWFLVEVKKSYNAPISKSLYYFLRKTGAKHAFQVIIDLPYVDQNCFDHHDPIIVPAKTFLSQLI